MANMLYSLTVFSHSMPSWWRRWRIFFSHSFRTLLPFCVALYQQIFNMLAIHNVNCLFFFSLLIWFQNSLAIVRISNRFGANKNVFGRILICTWVRTKPFHCRTEFLSMSRISFDSFSFVQDVRHYKTSLNIYAHLYLLWMVGFFFSCRRKRAVRKGKDVLEQRKKNRNQQQRQMCARFWQQNYAQTRMCETKSLKKHRKNWCSFHHFVRLLKITIYLFNQGVKFEVEPLCNRRHFNETKTFQYRNWIWLLKCSHFILFTWTKRCFMNRSELRWKKREGFSPHWFRHSIEIKQTSPWNGLNEIHAYDLRRVLESNSLTVQFIWFKYSSRCLNWFGVVLHQGQ